MDISDGLWDWPRRRVRGNGTRGEEKGNTDGGEATAHKLKYWIMLVVLTYGCIELVSVAGLLTLRTFRHVSYEPADILSTKHADILRTFVEETTPYITLSPTLGWSIKPNGSTKLNRSNSAGIRSSKEYALQPAHDIHRLSTFGDSFTHGDEVGNDDTWQARMESRDPTIEVLNFGVGGYGLDQAYLRYLEQGRQYRSHTVLIGFMSENIYRNVNTFRPFYYPKTGMPLAKPRFRLRGESIALLPNPLPHLNDYRHLLREPQAVLSHLGSNDFYYRTRYQSNRIDWLPTVRMTQIALQEIRNVATRDAIVTGGRYNESSEAFRITTKLLDVFYQNVISDDAQPIILIFPGKEDIVRHQRQGDKRYSPLLSYLKARKYPYIDLMDAFEEAAPASLFVVRHYSPLANTLAASHIHGYVTALRSHEAPRASR